MPDRSAMRLYYCSACAKPGAHGKHAAHQSIADCCGATIFSDCSIGGTPRARALHRAWHSRPRRRRDGRPHRAEQEERRGAARTRSRVEASSYRTGRLIDVRRSRGRSSRATAASLAAAQGRRTASVDLERLQLDRDRHRDRAEHALAGRAVLFAVVAHRARGRERDGLRPERAVRIARG